MPGDTKEPQSYGSAGDWTTGRTGSTVNEPKATPPPEQRDFYDDERESEQSAPHQGGDTSPVQLAENAQPVGPGRATPQQPPVKVTGTEGGAKRGSFFRKRDYEG
jgi:hypothetical protein